MAAAPVLQLLDSAGRQILQCGVDPCCGFAINYLHSVALSPVTDYFHIDGHDIYLDKTVYHDFGAGLPHAPAAGQQMKTENGRLVISGFNRNLGNFVLRVGRVAQHQLLILKKNDAGECVAKTAYELAKLASPGSPLTFIAR